MKFMNSKGGNYKMNGFIKRVKNLMKEKKLTQKELSALSGISEPSLCRYLKGQIEPRMDIIQNLARALNVSVEYLLGQSEEECSSAADETIRIVALNRKILSDEDKQQIIEILYGNK